MNQGQEDGIIGIGKAKAMWIVGPVRQPKTLVASEIDFQLIRHKQRFDDKGKPLPNPCEIKIQCPQNGTFSVLTHQCGDDAPEIGPNDVLVVCRDGVDPKSLGEDATICVLCGGPDIPRGLIHVKDGKGSGAFKMLIPPAGEDYSRVSPIPQALSVDGDHGIQKCDGFCPAAGMF